MQWGVQNKTLKHVSNQFWIFASYGSSTKMYSHSNLIHSCCLNIVGMDIPVVLSLCLSGKLMQIWHCWVFNGRILARTTLNYSKLWQTTLYDQEISLLMSEFLEMYTNLFGLFIWRMDLTSFFINSFINWLLIKRTDLRSSINFYQRQSGVGVKMSGCIADTIGFGLWAFYYPITHRVASPTISICHLNMELSTS